jgi:hypothetical protein
MHAVDVAVRTHRPEEAPGWRERYVPALFGDLEERVFPQRRLMPTEALLDWVASTSHVATAEPAERERLLAEVHEIAGRGPLDVSIPTQVVVADRV